MLLVVRQRSAVSTESLEISIPVLDCPLYTASTHPESSDLCLLTPDVGCNCSWNVEQCLKAELSREEGEGGISWCIFSISLGWFAGLEWGGKQEVNE